MEERSPSQAFGTIPSPDLSPTSSHIQDSRRDVHDTRSSPEDSYAGEPNPAESEKRTGNEPSGSEFRDQHVLVAEKSDAHRGETDAKDGDRRSPFRAEETVRGRRAVDYHGEDHSHRRSYRVERHRSSSCTRRCRSRRERSESPRRRRRFDEHRYREEYERRRRSLKPPSLGYFLRRRYSSLSFAVSRSHSRSGVLYRRTQWQSARRAYDTVRSTQLDRRGTRLRSVRSVETVPRESDGLYGNATSGGQESSRIIDADPPVMVGANSETERVIPKVALAGYHLEDPRSEDYAPGFRRDSHPQEHELVDLTVSTHEQRYEARQLYGSGDASLGPTGLIFRGFAQPPPIRTCTGRRSDIYNAENRDIDFAHRYNFQRCHYLSQEYPDICVRCSRPVESVVNYCPGGPRPEECLVNYCPVGPRPEECLLNYCPRLLENPRSVRDVSQAGGPPLRGFHDDRGKKLSVCFQAGTMRGASMVRQLPPDGERTWFDCPRELADGIVEGMVRTVRAQINEVDALRADMRDLRCRIANFVAEEKKAQEQSLAFIAAVKQRMAEET